MPRSDERGIALLLTLLVLTILVALILEFDAEARREYRDAAAFRDNFKATVLARASVQAARGVLQQDLLKDKQANQSFDALTDIWALPITNYAIGDGLLNAKIEDERGKLNLNDLAVEDAAAKEKKVLRFKRLFELLHINPDLVDAIVDWVDKNEVQEPSGAESLYYQSLRPPYRAANDHLETLLELRLIKGMTPEIIEKLSKVVTVYPKEGGDSKVNLNTADPLVIQALDNRITPSMAAAIVQARPFKKDNTDLDRVSSFDQIGKEIRLLYDIKSDLFLAHMNVRVNEVTRNA
ncbi:MAG: type II secretion system minor pseudopilin GspK, partial [Nitrospiraceae bacterium]